MKKQNASQPAKPFPFFIPSCPFHLQAEGAPLSARLTMLLGFIFFVSFPLLGLLEVLEMSSRPCRFTNTSGRQFFGEMRIPPINSLYKDSSAIWFAPCPQQTQESCPRASAGLRLQLLLALSPSALRLEVGYERPAHSHLLLPPPHPTHSGY